MRDWPLKTHWTFQLGPHMDGEEVVLNGWVWDIRNLGRIKFIVLRDGGGFAQLVVRAGDSPDEVLGIVDELNREDVVVARGVVRRSEKARAGFEVVVKELRVLARSKPLPIDLRGRAELATRIRYRFVDLKRPDNLAIFRAWSSALRVIRDTLYDMGFVEVFTPKIISSSSEGGAELFTVAYFERVAYLAQSPQLYKEQLTASLERVFEIAPAWRAEKHNTDWHLNEFISADVEAAFMDYRDVMGVLELVVRSVSQVVAEGAKDFFDVIRIDKIPEISYDDAVELARRKGVDVTWGDDLPHQALRVIADELGPAYFVTQFPADLRPFYTKRMVDDPRRSESFDLVVSGVEVASGSTRIHDRAELEEEMVKRGLNPRNFERHLEAFEYGMPPHAGWGLGVNRLIAALLRLGNVRLATLYPRDRTTVEP